MFRYVRLLKRENAFSYVAHLIESLCTRSFHQAAMMPDRSDILRFLKHRRPLSSTELSVSIVSLLTIWLKIVYNVFPFVFYASSPIWIRCCFASRHSQMRLARGLEVSELGNAGSSHKRLGFYNSRMTLCFRSTINDPTW